MAYGSGGQGGWGGGGNRDSDGRHGNAWESRSYSRTYDHRSEGEYTNIPEADDQVRAAAIQSSRLHARDAREAQIQAQSEVHFRAGLGKFITPKQNTWAAHAEAVKDDRTNLHFNPERYINFDKVIAERAGIKGLYDQQRPDYAKYEGLRTNIEVLRNFLNDHYLQGGKINDEAALVPTMRGIAEAIGDSLAGDKWYRRAFSRHVGVDVANVESVGAAEMYQYLQGIEDKPGTFQKLKLNIKSLFGLPQRDWNLPQLEESPFSPAALAAPPPERDITMSQAEFSRTVEERARAIAAECKPKEATDEDRLLAFSENAVRSARKLHHVSEIAPEARGQAVEEGRTILRWLRNLQFGEQDVETWLDQGTPAEQLSKVEHLSQLVSLYQRQHADAIARNPALADEAAVQDANDATGGLAVALASYTSRALPNDPRTRELEALAEPLPESAKAYEEQAVSRMLNAIELGFSYVAGDGVHAKKPAERLEEMSARIQATARKLRSVDTLEPPAREESIELAREILRKLKNLSFSDKTAEQLVDSGKPEDRAAFAQKIDEAVDIYKNLLQEAAEANPSILQNEQVREANNAVGTFAHTLLLMAAKEIPSSVAAAQQISADVTQNPEEWKALHNRTVDRLIKSMEGGLEKAVGDIQAQQEQQQDDDLAQQAIENALLQSSGSKRKRRRRRRSSGGGAAKQKKERLALEADDYVLKQGRFSQDARVARLDPQASLQGLRPEDLEAIRRLGGNLRDMGDQARNIPVTNVQAGDKITPDDKTAAQRAIDEQLKNPRGKGPRV